MTHLVAIKMLPTSQNTNFSKVDPITSLPALSDHDQKGPGSGSNPKKIIILIVVFRTTHKKLFSRSTQYVRTVTYSM